MREEYKKNFILLSQVAKEKKYAQEYLGLLARRGDIGSIRIGKRWYTSWEWFEEFERDAKMKKTETKAEEKTAEPVIAKEIEKRESRLPIGTFVAPIAMPVFSRSNLSGARELPTIDLRKTTHPKPLEEKIAVRESYSASNPPGQKNVRINLSRIPENMASRVGRERMKVREEAKGSSPSFLLERGQKFSLFPKFAFGAALMLMFFLLGWAGISHREELLKLARPDSRLDSAERAARQTLARLAGLEPGVVAGVSDTKTDLSAVKKSASEYLGDGENRIKGNISFSRVVIRAALEKE